MKFSSAVRGNAQRSAEFPSLGQAQTGFIFQFVGSEAFRIQQHSVPADDGHLIGGISATGVDALAFSACGRGEIQNSIETRNPRWDVNMKSPAIEQIAPPL